jgi:hypothetical protein
VLNYRGNLKPGQTIQADVERENVEVAVQFEVRDKRTIKFEHEIIPNMAMWQDIHAHFLAIDKRLLPYDSHIEEEDRPCHDNALLELSLMDGKNAIDTSGNDGGVDGGTNSKGQVLPPVIFPRVIDTTGGTKIHGALQRTLWLKTSSSNSETDGDEDPEDEDTH